MKKLLFLLLLALPAYGQNVIPIVNGNVTINPTTPSNSFKILVNQAVTVNIINPPGGFPPTVNVLFQQDGTGHAVTYGNTIVNGPTVSSSPNAVTSGSFQFDGSTNTWYGVSGGGSGGGGGTVTGVTGTTNQITVTNPTTNPVLSLPSTLVLPNGTTATTQTTGDNTTKAATDAFVIANAGTVTNVSGLADNLTCTSPTTTASCGLANTYTVVPVLTSAMKAGTADAYAAIQAAITTSIANGGEVYLPEGQYIVSAGLTAPSANFRMRGAGSQVNSTATTSITASASGYNTLVIGPGSINSQNPAGWLKDIQINGSGRPTGGPTGISALQMKAVIQYSVSNIALGGADMCLDLIDNNFGDEFDNIRTYQNGCNVGINLRIGSQSGSDLSFYNIWVVGPVAGVSISGGGGGYHFWGGQIGTDNNTAVNDLTGAVILCKDYLTGATGSCNADFHGTSFENTNYAWIFRGFGTAQISTYNINANVSNSATPALGIYKNTQYGCGQTAFHDTGLSGHYGNSDVVGGITSPLIEVSNFSTPQSGSYICKNIIEEGTYVSGSGAPTINGSQVWVNSMLVQSGLSGEGVTSNSRGVSLPDAGAPNYSAGSQLLLENISGVPNISNDNGTTSTPLLTNATLPVTPYVALVPASTGNTAINVGSNSSGVTSITTSAFGSANVAGDAIILSIGFPYGPVDITGCTDLNGDNFNIIIQGGSGIGGGANSILSYVVATNINAGSGNTVTCTAASSHVYFFAYAQEWSGIAKINPVETSGGPTVVTAATSGSQGLTLANPGDVVFAQMIGSSGSFGTVAAGTGFGGLIAFNGNTNLYFESGVFRTAGSISAGFSWANSTAAGVFAMALRPNVSFAPVSAQSYSTSTNCSSSASPAVCGSAAAGSVALPTGTNPTLVVNSSAVTANSQIMLTVDESLGTKLGITCNTTLSTLLNPVVTARTAATSFTFTIGAIIASNPACISYQIVN